MRHSVKSGPAGTNGSVGSLERRALDVVRLGEIDLLRSELSNLRTSHVLVFHNGGPDDLDGIESGRMATRHLHVHLGDGTAEGNISVLLVHVDGISAGKVAQEDAVVADGADLLLEDLGRGDDLTLDLANLVLSLHVVPELGASKNGIAGENTHAVKLGV